MEQMIIANWKMNLTLSQASHTAKALSNRTFSKQLLIAPPTPYIAFLQANYKQLNFGAQDVSIKNDFGPYTGENSAKFFKSCGINYAIIGHSERRNLLGENNEVVRIKAQNCLNNGITPIICIGERLEARKNGHYKEFLTLQLKESLPLNDGGIIIAYEPIWAIGTKITPTTDEINEIFDLIRNYESNIDYKLQLVYGGSINSRNCEDILNIPHIAGVLVGAASLNTEELFKILNS